MDVLKPYVLLACVAFFVGFVSYLALGRAVAPAAQAHDMSAQVSAPAPSPESPLVRSRSI